MGNTQRPPGPDVDHLGDAGYANFQRVRTFGLFKDTSDMVFKGVPISLNVTAPKPLK